jgi:4-hydroxybenzoate polyprenyltransferase
MIVKNDSLNISCPQNNRDLDPKNGLPLLFEWLEMIKFEHSIFALPFALSGLYLAKNTLPSWHTILWTIVAFIGARSAAMTLNRLIDASIDVLNPRTKTRAIPKGTIKYGQAIVFTLISFAIMFYAAFQLPPLCLLLSPIAVFILSFYSYTKRFTALCHIVLGIAVSGAALGGWVAAGGELNQWSCWLLMIAVATWVAGFDIIYALLDMDFDREKNVFSMPACYGVSKALFISSFLHIITALCLVALGINLSLGSLYWLGLACVLGMLVYEHSLVRVHDLSKVNQAFFTINGVVSIICFLAIFLDRIFFINFN